LKAKSESGSSYFSFKRGNQARLIRNQSGVNLHCHTFTAAPRHAAKNGSFM
jgi:hypothetical protein